MATRRPSWILTMKVIINDFVDSAKKHKRELVGLDPPVIHMSAYTTGGLKRLYKQISDPNVLNFPVYEHGQFTDESGHFQPEPGCIMASRYRVQYILNNRGQSAVLLQAQDLFCKRRAVVIKVMHTGLYKLGAQETQCLHHLCQADPEGNSNTLKLQNTFTFDEHYCMVFQPLVADSLTEVFHDIPKEKIIVSLRKITLRLLTTLGFLKQQNIIHADLKPENILLRKKGNLQSVTVIDFGNAIHHVHKEIALYYDDFELQTPLYRAPEVIFGMPFGTEIDMWSLGCILAELYLGKPLFLGTSKLDIVKEVRKLLGPFPSDIFQRGKFYHDLKSFTETCQQPDATKMIIKHFDCQDYAFADFIAGLLRFDPDERLNPYEAAQHPFLASELPIGYLLPLSAGKTSSYPAVKVSADKYKHKPSIATHIKRSQPSSYDLLSMGTCPGQQRSARQHNTQIATVSPLLKKSEQRLAKPLTADRYSYDGLNSDDSASPLIRIQSTEQRSRSHKRSAFDEPGESSHVRQDQSAPVINIRAQDTRLHHTSNSKYNGEHSLFEKVKVDQAFKFDEELLTCENTRRNHSGQKHQTRKVTAVTSKHNYFIPNAEIQPYVKEQLLPAQLWHSHESKPSNAKSKQERQTGASDIHDEVALVRDNSDYDDPYYSDASDSSCGSTKKLSPVCRTEAFCQQYHRDEDKFHYSQRINPGPDYGGNATVQIKRNRDIGNFAPIVLFENGVMKASNTAQTLDVKCNTASNDERIYVNGQKSHRSSFSPELVHTKASKQSHSLNPPRSKARITLQESPHSTDIPQEVIEDNINIGKTSGMHHGNLKSIMNMILQEQAKVENDLQEITDNVDIQHINQANSTGRWPVDLGNKHKTNRGTDVIKGHQMHQDSLHIKCNTLHLDQSSSNKQFLDKDQLKVSPVEVSTCDRSTGKHTADVQANAKPQNHRMNEKRVKYLGKNIFADRKRTKMKAVTEQCSERTVIPSTEEGPECLPEDNNFTREKPKSMKRNVVIVNKESDTQPLYYADDQSVFSKKTSPEHEGLFTQTLSTFKMKSDGQLLTSSLNFYQDSKYHDMHNTSNNAQNIKEPEYQTNEKIVPVKSNIEGNLSNSMVTGIDPKPSKTESVVATEKRHAVGQEVCSTRCDLKNDQTLDLTIKNRSTEYSSGLEMKIYRPQKWRRKLHFTKALVPRKSGIKQQKISRRMKRKGKEPDVESSRTTSMGDNFDNSGWSNSKVQNVRDPYVFMESQRRKSASGRNIRCRNSDKKVNMKGNMKQSVSCQSERTKKRKEKSKTVSNNFFNRDIACVGNKLSFKKSSERERNVSSSAFQDVEEALDAESIQSSKIMSDVLLGCQKNKKRIVNSFNLSEKKQSITSRQSADRQTRKRNNISSFREEENTESKRHKFQTYDDGRSAAFYKKEIISDEELNTDIDQFIDTVDSRRHRKSLDIRNRKSSVGGYQEMYEVDIDRCRKSPDVCNRKSVGEIQQSMVVTGKPNVYVTTHMPTSVSSMSTQSAFESMFLDKDTVNSSVINKGSKINPSSETFNSMTRVTSVNSSLGIDSSDSDQEILLIPSQSYPKTNTLKKQMKKVEVRYLYGTDDCYSSDNSSELELL